MPRRLLLVLNVLMAAAVVLAACAPAATPTPAPTEPPRPTDTAVPPTPAPPTDTPLPPTETPIPWEAPKGALVSVPAAAAPVLDGVADEAAWADAPVTKIKVEYGANMGSTTAELKSVYAGDMVYFLLVYADPTESQQRAPWVLGADGKWTVLVDPNDKGGDNNLYYEDKFSMLWPIADSVPDFAEKGCGTGCHFDDGTGKPFGNKYFETPDAMADLWHWKSIRNDAQIDDQYVDATPYDKEKAPEAGRHSDPKGDGSIGYVTNQTEDKTLPAFALPDNQPAPPYYILDSKKVPFDPTKYQAGDEVPGIVKGPYTGDRGDIAAGWKYADGQWTIEFGRKQVTASEKYDVQFTDLTATYYFGLAIFDNAQVRHAFEAGATPFVFQP